MLGVLVADRWEQQDVAWLDIAVDQPARVGGVQGTGDLLQDDDGPAGGQPALGLEHPAQVQRIHVAHGDVEPALFLASAVDGDDVGMVDGGGHPHLPKKALPERGVAGQGRWQQLEGNWPAAEVHLVGPIDHAHAAAADRRHDPVAGHHRADGGVGGHRHLHASRPRRPPSTRPSRQATERPPAWLSGDTGLLGHLLAVVGAVMPAAG
jgi:hypothetical protein